MEVEGSAGDLAIKIVDLEVQCEWLKKEDLEKIIVDLEAQFKWWNEDKFKLKERVMEVKGELERRKEKYKKLKGKHVEMREEYDSEKEKWIEEIEKIREKYWQVEVEKRELAVDLKAASSQQTEADQLRATEAEVERLKSLLEERDGMITTLLGKIEVLDGQNNRLERDFKDKMEMETKKAKMEEEKNSKLIQMIQALKREKEQMVAEVSKLFNEKMAAESEKRAFEENSKKTIAVLLKKNEDSEKEKKEMEAKLSQAQMERDAEMKRFLKEQMALKEEVRKVVLERDEANMAIKVLCQETETLEAQNEKLRMEKTILGLKREEDMESTNQAHVMSNVVGILGAPAAQNQVALLGSNAVGILGTPAQIQGNIKIEVQTPLSNAKSIQPFSRNLTRSRSSSDSFPLDHRATTAKRTRSGHRKQF